VQRQALGFHLLAFGVYAYGLYYDVAYVRVPSASQPPRSYGGRWKFLTFWDLVLQTFFFGFSVVLNLISWRTQQIGVITKLKKFRDFYFTVILFPLGLFVALTFWGLYVIDRELVFPKELDLYFPWWLNNVVHTFIVPTNLLEIVLLPHKYSPRIVSVPALCTFVAIYIAWTLYLAYFINIWTYPIFAVLNNLQRGCFFVALTSFFVILYITGEKINQRVWGKQTEDHSNSQKKRH